MALFSSSSLNTTPDTSSQQTVSTFAKPYVDNILNKSSSMLNAPTPTYGGQLTAGYSPLQQEAWQGLSGLTLPTSLQTAGTNLQNIAKSFV
jgi:uncharacterized protein YukE